MNAHSRKTFWVVGTVGLTGLLCFVVLRSLWGTHSVPPLASGVLENTAQQEHTKALANRPQDESVSPAEGQASDSKTPDAEASEGAGGASAPKENPRRPLREFLAERGLLEKLKPAEGLIDVDYDGLVGEFFGLEDRYCQRPTVTYASQWREYVFDTETKKLLRYYNREREPDTVVRQYIDEKQAAIDKAKALMKALDSADYILDQGIKLEDRGERWVIKAKQYYAGIECSYARVLVEILPCYKTVISYKNVPVVPPESTLPLFDQEMARHAVEDFLKQRRKAETLPLFVSEPRQVIGMSLGPMPKEGYDIRLGGEPRSRLVWQVVGGIGDWRGNQVFHVDCETGEVLAPFAGI